MSKNIDRVLNHRYRCCSDPDRGGLERTGRAVADLRRPSASWRPPTTTAWPTTLKTSS